MLLKTGSRWRHTIWYSGSFEHLDWLFQVLVSYIWLKQTGAFLKLSNEPPRSASPIFIGLGSRNYNTGLKRGVVFRTFLNIYKSSKKGIIFEIPKRVVFSGFCTELSDFVINLRLLLMQCCLTNTTTNPPSQGENKSRKTCIVSHQWFKYSSLTILKLNLLQGQKSPSLWKKRKIFLFVAIQSQHPEVWTSWCHGQTSRRGWPHWAGVRDRTIEMGTWKQEENA